MQNNLYRERLLSEAGHNFCSNDYLNLSTHPEVQTFFQEGFSQYPVGSGGSMLVSGYHPIHEALEKRFASHLGVDQAILFNSGYVANLSIMQLLAKKKVPCLLDKTLHASFYDGLRLGGNTYSRYPHQDYVALKRKWQSQVLCIESVFSMSGHCTPLKEIAALSHAPMIVDEAHAFGLFGEKGLGRISEAQLSQDRIPLRTIPLGKAFGASGAIVAGQKAWIEALIQVARPYIYSTGMSPAYAYGLYKLLPFFMQAEDLRKKLWHNVRYFRQIFPFATSDTPIQFIKVGSSKKSLELMQYLHHQGFFVRAIRPPTVLEGDAGIRVTLNAHHTNETIKQLLEGIKAYDAALVS